MPKMQKLEIDIENIEEDNFIQMQQGHYVETEGDGSNSSDLIQLKNPDDSNYLNNMGDFNGTPLSASQIDIGSYNSLEYSTQPNARFCLPNKKKR